jgi:hypothetical protein
MTDREQNILDMFISTTAFDGENSNDYIDLPDAAASFAIVGEAIEALENYSAAQKSGASGRAVEQMSVLDAAIRRKMKRFSKTARALNIDDAGFKRLFHIPDGNNRQDLMAAAREFVVEARRFPIEFKGRGIPTTLAGELETDINKMDAAILAKASGKIETVGATAGVDQKVEAGMKAEIILDSIMHNVYFDNPAKLAQWMTARHVKKASRIREENGDDPDDNENK